MGEIMFIAAHSSQHVTKYAKASLARMYGIL